MARPMPIAPTNNRPALSGDSQPRCGACFNPISRLASATATRTSTRASSFASSAKSVSWRGSRYGVVTAAMSPGMTLIRNSHGHDQVSVMKPPTTGPIVGASTATTPPTVAATAWSRGGNNRNTAEKTAGKSLDHTKHQEHGKAAAQRAADRRNREKPDRGHEQPSERQDAREQAGQ